MKHYTVAIAGSSSRTVLCAEALAQHPQFSLSVALTPPPQPQGRKKVLTPSPVEQYARQNELPVLFVEKKIDAVLKDALMQHEQPDFLLVVDFGYLVPNWLLAWPKVAPINIHPSALPKWRGSSPGQFSLLYGERLSAVSIMVMDSQLDHGPLLATLPFEVPADWTQTEYYVHSFGLASRSLPQTLLDFTQGRIMAKPQPDTSPTTEARRLSKADGFIEWQAVTAAMAGQDISQELQSELLESARGAHGSLAALVAHACRALSPWPGLWTEVQTAKGTQRMKLLQCQLSSGAASSDTHPTETLRLTTVQLEGKTQTPWSEAQAAVLE